MKNITHSPNLTMHEQGVQRDGGFAFAEFSLGNER